MCFHLKVFFYTFINFFLSENADLTCSWSSCIGLQEKKDHFSHLLKLMLETLTFLSSPLLATCLDT